jgi:hypothetical protein
VSEGGHWLSVPEKEPQLQMPAETEQPAPVIPVIAALHESTDPSRVALQDCPVV